MKSGEDFGIKVAAGVALPIALLTGCTAAQSEPKPQPSVVTVAETPSWAQTSQAPLPQVASSAPEANTTNTADPSTRPSLQTPQGPNTATKSTTHNAKDGFAYTCTTNAGYQSPLNPRSQKKLYVIDITLPGLSADGSPNPQVCTSGTMTWESALSHLVMQTQTTEQLTEGTKKLGLGGLSLQGALKDNVLTVGNATFSCQDTMLVEEINGNMSTHDVDPVCASGELTEEQLVSTGLGLPSSAVADGVTNLFDDLHQYALRAAADQGKTAYNITF